MIKFSLLIRPRDSFLLYWEMVILSLGLRWRLLRGGFFFGPEAIARLRNGLRRWKQKFIVGGSVSPKTDH